MNVQQVGWLEELNPPQHQAVVAGEGPLLVVAGAGSGKTRTLAYRVAHLVRQGVDPARILLLTFTRRAAEQMLHRAAAAIENGSAIMPRVWGGTFHAMANRLLRIYARPAGLTAQFTIVDQADAEDLLDMVRHDLSLSAKGSRFPRKSTCLSIYSRCMNGGEALGKVLDDLFPWCAMWEDELRALFGAYVERKQKQNVLDYDDLLQYWHQLLMDDELAESIGNRFEHILVDEYQDTNQIQSSILIRMRHRYRNIMVVGDDAQSIYGFRCATVTNMLEFPQHFPGATIIKLEQNYRSVEPILNATNHMIAQARQRYSKELWSTRKNGQRPQLITCHDEPHQDELVIKQLLEHHEQGIPLRKQAVLFRAASHSNSLELALSRHNIPFRKYGGLKFLEAAHIKDMISFLRVVENAHDEMAWFRILQLLDGIGPATARRIFEHLASHQFEPASIVNFLAPPPAREQMRQLGILVSELARSPQIKPSVQLQRIQRFYEPILKHLYENPEPRANDIEHLSQLAGHYRCRKNFLTDLVLDPPQVTGANAGPPDLDEDWLVLSTIHSAKGCEWDAVYLIHAADGFLPSDMATSTENEVEEEMRLVYVAMTRARDFLYVTWPLRYYHGKHRSGDSFGYAQCCRFFTTEVRSAMDEISAGPEDRFDEAVAKKPSLDIGASMRAMWNGG